jgi:hypothetical protein
MVSLELNCPASKGEKKKFLFISTSTPSFPLESFVFKIYFSPSSVKHTPLSTFIHPRYRYLETYGSALHLEASDGSKVKLKEYLLSDEMMSLLNNFQGERLRLVLVKAGHDRKYSIIVDA